ncbi:MAG: hypothetical protein WCH57_09985 [Verrucomicrobiota bacterium]
MSRFLRFQSFVFRRAIVALLVAQLLVVVAMTVCPALHHWAHPDADDQDHECVVTLFAHGGCDGVPVALTLVVFLVVPRTCVQRICTIWIESLFLSHRVLEHAPPGL